MEADALAYLTDPGLAGRNVISQHRWPKLDSEPRLKHKLGENIWRLILPAERSVIDIHQALDTFLSKTQKLFYFKAGLWLCWFDYGICQGI
ncbi:hypothetical protein [Flavobacterium anhuiense]|uniref:hypothetical protein n=1 Tax=Flavobacterium anhuiense TaxID=459526 RepID=UPI0021B406D3|nr:hypothetical protein [Flavobacterium anhuiense]